MSFKSVQGSLNTSLGKLTINNSYNANTNTSANPFTLESNTLATSNNGDLLLNGFKVLSESSYTIITATSAGITVEALTPLSIPLDLFDYNFLSTENTLVTFSYVGDGSSVYAQNIVINYLDNLLTITLNNDGADAISITQLNINLFNP